MQSKARLSSTSAKQGSAMTYRLLFGMCITIRLFHRAEESIRVLLFKINIENPSVGSGQANLPHDLEALGSLVELSFIFE